MRPMISDNFLMVMTCFRSSNLQAVVTFCTFLMVMVTMFLIESFSNHRYLIFFAGCNTDSSG